jgi:subtilase family serine protease
VTVTVTVKNTGTFPEMPTLTLTDQTTGTIWGPIDIGTLEPGATTTTPFQWTATPLGVHTIRGQISLAEDSNAANDAKSVQIEVKAPIHDVAVTALTAPASAITGQPVQITATVANLGTFEEQFNVTLTDNDAPVGSWINILLDAGTAAALSSIQWTPATQGDHTLRATASPVPDESPLPNNVIEKSVNVSDVPSLGVTVTTNKPTYAVGNTVTITTGVTNNGGSSVSGASVQVVIKGPNGRTTSKSGTTGASGAFVWSWGTSSFTPLLYGRGTYTVNATASKSGYQSGVGATSFLLP